MATLERAKALMTKVDDLTLRERAIVFGGLLTIMFLGWYAYMMEPLSREERQLIAALDKKREQLQTLNDQFVLLTQKQGKGADAANRKKLADLRGEEARIRDELGKATSHLVKAEAMPDMLRQVLNRSQGLTLVKLSGLGSEPLVAAAGAAKTATPNDAAKPGAGKATAKPATDKAAAGAGPAPAESGATAQANGELTSAYKHGLEIQFTGDFPSTLAYMRKLEGSEWGFFWDSVDFAVADYPNSSASLRVFTLSLNPNWIGT